jgi:hypothetical protein
MRFRKKPVIIEAMQLTDSTLDEIFNWINTKDNIATLYDMSSIKISTLEGSMYARIGDWVIKGVNGEFYPCKPDIFEKTYESITDEEIQ